MWQITLFWWVHCMLGTLDSQNLFQQWPHDLPLTLQRLSPPSYEKWLLILSRTCCHFSLQNHGFSLSTCKKENILVCVFIENQWLNLGLCDFFKTSNIHFSFEDVSVLALLLLPLRFLQGICTEMNIFSCFLIKSKCQVNFQATRSWGAWFPGCPVPETSVELMLMIWNQSPLFKMSSWTCPFFIVPLWQ